MSDDIKFSFSTMDVDAETAGLGASVWPISAGACRLGSNQSLHYFWEDGSIFITLADWDIIYSVWGSRLSTFSGFFSDLSTLPQPPDDPTPDPAPSVDSNMPSADSEPSVPLTEKAKALQAAHKSKEEGGNGKSVTSPLKIQATPTQFEVFLECIFTQTGDDIQTKRPAEFWMMALEMADFFDCARVRDLATQWLAGYNSLDPALRLNLAMMYAIKDWVKPAVQALARIPLPDLSPEQINLIGFSAYIILAEAKAKITEHRVLCSLTVPEVFHSKYCGDKDACKKVWDHAWWGEATKHGMAVALVHPAQMPARKILASLPNVITSWHMSVECRKLTIKAFTENPSVLLKEERYLAKAIEELQKF
ncbi:hypothetical protein B0H16DRAFT_427547 [Mycena metata]|uniref:BTB domain-containing protein n=1 Tax=Mycena metata TaxID=1033252 RepID=A0AAD7JH51_9AGAR|nr:hypothetical protein B0H16DRAFT_427547 [Mycena metata]